MKRLLDFLLSSVGLICALPLLPIVALIIRLESRGPALFAQTRVGRGEKLFTCYKLRTMLIDTPQAPTHHTPAAATTKVGRWLRKWKLDELPQLYNVLRGDMSLVGPRPCLPSQQELIVARRPRGVYSLRPGITGLAQVRGIDMSDPIRLATTDAEYQRNRTFGGDLKLLAATVTGQGRGIDHTRSSTSGN